ncbi:hypothetical protein BDP27DRAFT_1426737 [Rhodocollybia butyracea]|uniref:Uncharacterized protein n=1 Tax=Rhodocollybia butyracea TaxID=206335 RepID=A0A9P5PJ44_9AGAR|nr:hypothetical protein BDP27DRAFT_1426737 [Rhodocollybia butyracea]
MPHSCPSLSQKPKTEIPVNQNLSLAAIAAKLTKRTIWIQKWDPDLESSLHTKLRSQSSPSPSNALEVENLINTLLEGLEKPRSSKRLHSTSVEHDSAGSREFWLASVDVSAGDLNRYNQNFPSYDHPHPAANPNVALAALLEVPVGVLGVPEME